MKSDCTARDLKAILADYYSSSMFQSIENGELGKRIIAPSTLQETAMLSNSMSVFKNADRGGFSETSLKKLKSNIKKDFLKDIDGLLFNPGRAVIDLNCKDEIQLFQKFEQMAMASDLKKPDSQYYLQKIENCNTEKKDCHATVITF